MPDVQNGWNEWSKYVLKELERLNTCQERIEHDIGTIKTEIATLKVRSGVWGGVAGLIPAIGVLIYWVLSRR